MQKRIALMLSLFVPVASPQPQANPIDSAQACHAMSAAPKACVAQPEANSVNSAFHPSSTAAASGLSGDRTLIVGW